MTRYSEKGRLWSSSSNWLDARTADHAIQLDGLSPSRSVPLANPNTAIEKVGSYPLTVSPMYGQACRRNKPSRSVRASDLPPKTSVTYLRWLLSVPDHRVTAQPHAPPIGLLINSI